MSRRLLFLAFTIFTLLWGVQPAVSAEQLNANVDHDQLSLTPVVLEMVDLLHQYHLEQPDVHSLMDGAVYGVLDALGDPYAEYFPEDQIKNFTDALDGDLIGVGIELQAGERYPFLVRVIEDSPADKAGLEPGDLLVAVDGVSIEGYTLTDVVNKVRGDRSTSVGLTILRGEQLLNVTLRREDIHVATVEFEMLPDNIGYLKINSFGSHTLNEFDQVMQSVDPLSMAGLILDLRDNGGGYLQEAVEISSRFLPQGSLVTTIIDGRGFEEEVLTEQEPIIAQVPIIILVNNHTASASEILAASLKDHGLARLLGTTTFGKGVAQSIVPLKNGGMLKFTSAKFLTPSGYDLEQGGLMADHFVLTRALQKEVAQYVLDPSRTPRLIIDADNHLTQLNGQSINLDLKIIHRGNETYLPLRPVLEALLYQVHWQNGSIIIYQDQENKLIIGHGGSISLENIIIEGGMSYIPAELLKRLHIRISGDSDNHKIIVERE